MVTYEYDANQELFKKRIDEDSRRGGKPLYVNITEANKIINLINLGYSIYEISRRVKLSNPKAGSTTVTTFANRYKNGDIIIPKDAPAPSLLFESITDGDRLTALEERIGELEDKVTELKNRLSETVEKPTWKQRLGL